MKTALTRKEVIKEANDELRNQPWFETGMEIQNAEMEGHFLALNAVGITDSEGAILMENVQRFELFAKSFAERYRIQEE